MTTLQHPLSQFEAPTEQVPDDSRPLPRRTPLKSHQRRFLRRWNNKDTRQPLTAHPSSPVSPSHRPTPLLSHRILGAPGTTTVTPRQWARHCMWDAVGLNCCLFGLLIVLSLWSGQVVQAIPSSK